METTKPKILFLCTGNSARSQMAEAFLRKYGGDYFEVYSAGLESRGINPYTQKVMEEIGVDLSQHYSKSVKEYLGRTRFKYLITVCATTEKDCPTVFPDVDQKMNWPFEDPVTFAGSEAETLKKFREVRDQLEEHIKSWLALLQRFDMMPSYSN